MYDDLLIYIAEMCKQLKTLEVNSDRITDLSMCEVFKKCTNLKTLDISGCPNFNGTAFVDAEDLLACLSLQKLILGIEFKQHQLMKLAQEKLLPKIPHLKFDLNMAKKFDL